VGQAFERGAAAMFAVMTDLAAVQRSMQVAFDFEEADLELALVIWLNRLLAEARARSLIFGIFSCSGMATTGMAQPGASRGGEVRIGYFETSGQSIFLEN